MNNADGFKPIDTWRKEDVDKYLLSLREKNKESTIGIKKILLKQYFGWLGKPEIIKHIRVKLPKNHLKREDILAPEDVNKMVETIESPMYKALIVFLYESGVRISEALALTVTDIQDTDQGMIVSIKDEKTDNGYRSCIYPTSSQFIRNHITYSGLTKENKLFPISKSWANTMLKRIGKNAEIEKPITCHKFRHAQATDMVLRGYQESIIRKKLGWTDDSGMIARYQHLVDDDVIDATLEKNGQEIKKHPIVNVNTAEPLNIIDAGVQLRKLTEDNEELKNRLDILYDLMFTNVEGKVNFPKMNIMTEGEVKALFKNEK